MEELFKLSLSSIKKNNFYNVIYHQAQKGKLRKSENYSSFLRYYRIVEPFSILCKTKERILVDTHSENKLIMFNERPIIFQEIMRREFLKH